MYDKDVIRKMCLRMNKAKMAAQAVGNTIAYLPISSLSHRKRETGAMILLSLR